MENSPMSENLSPKQAYEPEMTAPQTPQVPPMPPEIQQKMSKSQLRRADNRASLLLMLMQVFAVPITFLLVLAYVLANKTEVFSLLQSGGAKALMRYFYGNSGLVMLLTISATFGAMVVTVLVAKPMLKRKIFGAWRKPQSSPAILFAGIALMLGAAEAGGIVVNLLITLLKQAGLKTGTPNFSLSGDRTTDMILVAYVCIIGPVLEETLFRGMILQSLRPWGDWFAIVASAILFGVFHLNLIQGIPAALMGLVLGFVAVKSESILPTILMHIFNNSLSMAVTILGVGKNRTVQGIYGVIVLVAIVVSVILLALKNSEVSEIRARPAPAPRVEHRYPVFFFQSAAFWVLIAFFAAYSVYLGNSASSMISKF